MLSRTFYKRIIDPTELPQISFNCIVLFVEMVQGWNILEPPFRATTVVAGMRIAFNQLEDPAFKSNNHHH